MLIVNSLLVLIFLVGLLALILGKSPKNNLLGKGAVKFGVWSIGLSSALLTTIFLVSLLWSALTTSQPTPPASNGSVNGGAFVNDNATPAKSPEEKLLDELRKEAPHVKSTMIEEDTIWVIFNIPSDGNLYPLPEIPFYYQAAFFSEKGKPYTLSVGNELIPVRPNESTEVAWKTTISKCLVGSQNPSWQITVMYRKISSGQKKTLPTPPNRSESFAVYNHN